MSRLATYFLCLFACAVISPLHAQTTFFVGDSTTTVSNPPGLSAGDTILFQGTIITNGSDAVRFNGLPFPTTITFSSSSVVRALITGGGGDQAVFINNDFEGTFSNAGILESQNAEAIRFDEDFTGSFTNTGLIRSTDAEGVEFADNFDGIFINSGRIEALTRRSNAGIHVRGNFNGTLINTGTILTEEDEGILIRSFSGNFLNTGTITTTGDTGPAVSISNNFDGDFTNRGTITAVNYPVVSIQNLQGRFLNTGTLSTVDDNGVEFSGDFEGSFENRGTISSSRRTAIRMDDFFASFLNSGTISSGESSVLRFNGFTEGTITNSGILETGGMTAVRFARPDANFVNAGGRITAMDTAIEFAGGNAALTLSGPGQIQGTLLGAPGTNDVLTFSNIRGISDEKRAELLALAEADAPGVTSVTLFGETITWDQFEDVRVDLASLESYEDLLRPGLGGFGEALDNVLMLNDEIRAFLNPLNDASLEELNEIAGTSSGQVIVSGTDDFVRHQDTNLFNLFTNEFSTLRNDPSGGGSIAANERNGLFTREVQVGVTINEPIPNHTHAWVAGYVGNGTQDPGLTRSESDIDNTSILFGASQHVSNEWMLGLWGGYVDNDANVDRFGSLLQNEAGYVGINANYISDDLFANFLLGYGFHDQLSIRQDFQGNSFRGDAVGNQALLQAQVGRDFFFGGEGNLKASPYLGFTVSALAMGGFTENGNALTRLQYEAETTISAQSVVGINLSTLRETKKGWIQPSFDAAWWHEFAGADDYGVSLATPGFLNAFQVTSPVTNEDRAVIQAGLEFGFDRWNNVSFDATYFGTFGSDDYSSHGGAFSATFEF